MRPHPSTTHHYKCAIYRHYIFMLCQFKRGTTSVIRLRKRFWIWKRSITAKSKRSFFRIKSDVNRHTVYPRPTTPNIVGQTLQHSPITRFLNTSVPLPLSINPLIALSLLLLNAFANSFALSVLMYSITSVLRYCPTKSSNDSPSCIAIWPVPTAKSPFPNAG